MKKTLLLTIVALFILLLQTAAFSQITITKTDVDSYLANSVRTSYTWNYFSSQTFNVGTASNSSQSFDFSSIPSTPDSMRDTTSTQYVSPVGLPGAENFPDATTAQREVQIQGPGTITIAVYYQSAEDGIYILGYAIHYFIPTIIDTLFLTAYQPKSLLIPLPLTLGTQRVATDSVIDFSSNTKTVTTHVNTCNGYGNLLLPDNSNVQGLRIQEDRVQTQYNLSGEFMNRESQCWLTFATQQIVITRFQVDTSFTGGTTGATGFTYEKRTGASGIREISKNVPSGYELSQNFPNPFNPTTSINFKISKEGFTTLKIMNVLGQEVATLVSKTLTPGSYSVTWNASDVQSGVYFYKIQSGNYSETKKLILMK